MNDAIPRDVPFTLSCTECDRDTPDTYEEAVRDGWTQIEYYPEGYSENFIGFCPDCRREEEELADQVNQTFADPDEQGGDACPT